MLDNIYKFIGNRKVFDYLLKRFILVAVSPIKLLGKVLRARKGNRFSRVFRVVFEYVKIKQLLGIKLVIIFILSTFIPQSITIEAGETANNLTKTPYVFTTQQSVQYPVKLIRVTQGFKFYHKALDLDGVTGDTVYPIMVGRVISAEYSKLGYGKSVVVDHNNGLTSLYAHLSTIDVQLGDEVDLNTKLGEMGSTGRSFGDHLHLEIRENGQSINPHAVLPTSVQSHIGTTQINYKGY